MTIAGATPSNEVDYFSLHSRKSKQINIEMLDYVYVKKCQDLDELKGILAKLRSGEEGRYPDLEKATEDKLLSILPERERLRILQMQRGPSQKDIEEASEQLQIWSEDIDHLNKSLIEKKQKHRYIPPVRGASEAIPNKEINQISSKKMENQDIKKKQAIPAYDFRAWEKYDVDRALQELDEKEALKKEQILKSNKEIQKRAKDRRQELASLPSYIKMSELSEAERKVYALQEKHKGNEAFKVNDNEDAVLYYTRSIAFDDTNAVLYANRAMARLRLKNFSMAEDDCTRAIELDPLYGKAWSRRGMTRVRRGKYEESIKDFDEALKLAPNSKEIEKLRTKAMEKWKEVDGTIDKQLKEANESEKKFTRFEILENDDSEEESEPGEDVGNRISTEDTNKPFQRFEILEE